MARQMKQLGVTAKLTSGYHRDFQLLKEPLFRGVQRTVEMLDILTVAIPKLGVDAERCWAAIGGSLLVTDEVIQRVESGEPFRSAYRAVATELKQGTLETPPACAEDLIRRRSSTGGIGNLGLGELRRRLHGCETVTWQARTQFQQALATLQAPLPLPDRIHNDSTRLSARLSPPRAGRSLSRR